MYKAMKIMTENIYVYLHIHAVAQLVQAGRLRVRFPMVSLEFFIVMFPAALWP
jgi:hypothetical protein